MWGATSIAPMDWSWDFVKRLREMTDMRLMLKGIVRREGAVLAVQLGVDGLIVSNHGGRSEESGHATTESLPEVVGGVGGKIPVLPAGTGLPLMGFPPLLRPC